MNNQRPHYNRRRGNWSYNGSRENYNTGRQNGSPEQQGQQTWMNGRGNHNPRRLRSKTPGPQRSRYFVNSSLRIQENQGYPLQFPQNQRSPQESHRYHRQQGPVRGYHQNPFWQNQNETPQTMGNQRKQPQNRYWPNPRESPQTMPSESNQNQMPHHQSRLNHSFPQKSMYKQSGGYQEFLQFANALKSPQRSAPGDIGHDERECAQEKMVVDGDDDDVVKGNFATGKEVPEDLYNVTRGSLTPTPRPPRRVRFQDSIDNPVAKSDG